MGLLDRKVAILENGIYQATLAQVTEPVANKTLCFEWDIQGVTVKQNYSNMEVLDDHMERFATQQGLTGSCSVLDLVGKTYKVYVSRRVGDTGASFRNVAPATEQESSISIED